MLADLIDLACGEARIRDDRPGVDPACGQEQPRQRNAVFADNDHAVAGPDPERTASWSISIVCVNSATADLP